MSYIRVLGVHVEESGDTVQFLPEEYPGLPQEADITCQKYCFRVEGCSRLATLSIGKGAMPRTKHLEVSFLKRLKNFELPEGLFEDCETFGMTGAAARAG